ncbi:Fur family transcriptional regulator, ferric uptake regulator [Mucilaginibacter gossypiicola]|uniref:Fur family transcriptional regulator, ferric uptake regulator n=1 Tax=Mucilaginibacter gossypiicola TaxID=551995 RepID=A0A1H8BDP0_9SPHI|nr:transcriptional repressor [Mucilaginibacter gossypiicola]SEM80932.1 Fur family transcriptional regulator, ferric uptake regulator [Mucilaginibacter gossypiicola]
MKELEKQLQEKQIKPTAMRLVVLDYLLKQTSAVSLTDMEVSLKKTDRVTLYRTVKTFEEHGLVHRVEDGTGVTKFALCQPDCTANGHHDLHIHFYCTNCKETHCLPRTHIPEIMLPDGYDRQEINLLVKGLCAACKK